MMSLYSQLTVEGIRFSFLLYKIAQKQIEILFQFYEGFQTKLFNIKTM